MTNSAEKGWKGWGSCYSFSCNIFGPLVPAVFQSGMATPCGVRSCANAQEVSNCTPTQNYDLKIHRVIHDIRAALSWHCIIDKQQKAIHLGY